jgi:DNA N-6-adenine-methyltransferase (Dam)
MSNMKNDYAVRRAQLEKAGLLTEKKARDLDYQTPRRALDRIDFYWGGQIPFDPASHPSNPTKARSFLALTDAELTLSAAWFEKHKTATLKKYLEAKAEPFVIKAKKENEEDRHYVWEIFPSSRDGLRAEWPSGGIFVNPPYGGPMKAWLERIGEEAARGKEIIALIPVNRTETDYWQANVAMRAAVVCWVRKRLAFVRPSTGEPAKGNPYASSLWGFNVDVKKFLEACSPLGRVVQQTVLSVDYTPATFAGLIERAKRKLVDSFDAPEGRTHYAGDGCCPAIVDPELLAKAAYAEVGNLGDVF